jgi:broad specificity phosphatase PhoE
MSRAVKLVVSSPLTRALQTARLAFPDHEIIAAPFLQEIEDHAFKIWENNPENQCRTIPEIRGKFKNVNVSLLPASTGSVRQRGTRQEFDGDRKDFFSWLSARPEKIIACVSHCNLSRAVVPFSHRPRGPNCLGTAASYWPKNAPAAYLMTLEGEGITLERKLNKDEAILPAPKGKRIIWIRHAQSEAQIKRAALKKTAKLAKQGKTGVIKISKQA